MQSARAAARPLPAARLTGRRLALALTLGLHLLILFFWMGARRPRGIEAPRVVSILLQLRAPRAVAPAAPPSAPPHLPRTVPPRATPAPLPAASAAASTVASTVAATPVPAAERMPAAATANDSSQAAHTPAGGGFSLDAIKGQAGRIDRELRQGKPGVPIGADTPWTRFGRALESAHVEPGLAESIDSYTYPDGVIVYRKRVAGVDHCRRSGSVRGDFVPGASGIAGAGDAADVPCPKGVAWKRD